MNIAFRIPEYTAVILVCFAVSALVLTLVSIGCVKHFTKERIIRERENIIRIMQSLNTMAVLWSSDFRYIEANPELTKNIGYTSEDLSDMKTLQKVLPPDAFAPSLQAVINSRDEEFAVTAKGGAKVNTIWNTSIVSTIAGKNSRSCLMLSIGLDISETVRMKEELIKYSKELAESENRYTLSMGLSEIGLLLKEPGKTSYLRSADGYARSERPRYFRRRP